MLQAASSDITPLVTALVVLNSTGLVGIVYWAGKHVQRLESLNEEVKQLKSSGQERLVVALETKLDTVVEQLKTLQVQFDDLRNMVFDRFLSDAHKKS